MRLILGACFGLVLSIACGDDDSHPNGVTNSSGTGGVAQGGSGGTNTTSGGSRVSGGEHSAAGEGSAGKAPEDGGGSGDGAAAGDAARGGDGGRNSNNGGAITGGQSTGGSREPMFPCPSDSATKEPAIPATCAPGTDFVLDGPVPVDAGNAARLISVSPDELSIAWSAFGSSSELYFIADRESIEEPFAAPIRIETSGSVVGMSPDGLRVVTLSSDQRTYAEASRSGRHLAFGAETPDTFALLNMEAASESLRYADGVVAADDQTLLYNAMSEAGAWRLLISNRDADEAWPVGEPVPGCEFEAHGALVRRPTGIAADGLTLFFFDPDRGAARAAWRTSADEPFTFFRDLPGVGLAAPTALCDKLYYTGSVGQSPIFMAKSGH